MKRDRQFERGDVRDVSGRRVTLSDVVQPVGVLSGAAGSSYGSSISGLHGKLAQSATECRRFDLHWPVNGSKLKGEHQRTTDVTRITRDTSTSMA